MEVMVLASVGDGQNARTIVLELLRMSLGSRKLGESGDSLLGGVAEHHGGSDGCGMRNSRSRRLGWGT